MRAVLRRTKGVANISKEQAIKLKHLTIDPTSRSVLLDGQEINLTAKEFDLLYYFAQHPDHVFTRAQLLASVWDDEFYTDPATVTVHIRRLREKIEKDPSQPAYLLTVWGVGYKFSGES